jgi:predicted GIY-YIG superfamily endonuclease
MFYVYMMANKAFGTLYIGHTDSLVVRRDKAREPKPSRGRRG